MNQLRNTTPRILTQLYRLTQTKMINTSSLCSRRPTNITFAAPRPLFTTTSTSRCLIFPAGLRLLHQTKLLKNCTPGQPSQTNLTKDVILFKYENPKYFRYMNIFAYCQFLFWSYMSHFAYTELRDTPMDKLIANESDIAWWQKINLGDSKYRTAITIFCFGIGEFWFCFI